MKLPYCVQIPAPESLLLPWYSQGKGLFASNRKVRTNIPISSPVWFDFSRRLNNWVDRVFVCRGYLWFLGQLWCTAVLIALRAGLATTCFSLAYLVGFTRLFTETYNCRGGNRSLRGP